MQHVERCLREAGYSFRLDAGRSSTVLFEDYSLFGFGTVYESVDSLLQTWKTNQDNFLHMHAPFLRAAARKAWNCYTVHFTDAQATEAELQALFDIEEDFTGTRKIARAGLTTASDVQRALYPLIPVQNLLKMQPGGQGELDIAQRFHDWPPGALTALLGSGTAEDIVELLLETD
jgi:hypothetical protein